MWFIGLLFLLIGETNLLICIEFDFKTRKQPFGDLYIVKESSGDSSVRVGRKDRYVSDRALHRGGH